MHLPSIITISIALCLLSANNCIDAKKKKSKKPKKQLQIGVKKKIDECTRRSRVGDELHIHYSGKLATNGEEFDSSRVLRDTPLVFRLGATQVIKGWDLGLVNMCEGEQRKLVVPPHLAYGKEGSPPMIPPSATLVFDVELVKITEGRKSVMRDLRWDL